jgi:hypothetical protein
MRVWYRSTLRRVTDYNSVAQRLSYLVTRDQLWSSAAQEASFRNHNWYNLFLGRVSLAIGDDAIVFLSSSGTIEREPNSPDVFIGRVVVYLDAVYLDATVRHEEDGSDNSKIAVVVRSRKHLASMAITGGTRAWGPNEAQPRRPSVLLTYVGGDSLELPLGTPEEIGYAELEGLMPALRQDLAASWAEAQPGA